MVVIPIVLGSIRIVLCKLKNVWWKTPGEHLLGNRHSLSSLTMKTWRALNEKAMVVERSHSCMMARSSVWNSWVSYCSFLELQKPKIRWNAALELWYKARETLQLVLIRGPILKPWNHASIIVSKFCKNAHSFAKSLCSSHGWLCQNRNFLWESFHLQISVD